MTIYHKTLGHGPELVLLHGWAFHSGIWESWVHALKHSFRVHLIDLPGFGQSAGVPMAINLTDLLQQLLPILPNRAIYCGWSFGGLIAMALAIYEQKRVASIITLGSTPYFIADNHWSGISNVDFLQFYSAILTDVTKGLQRFLLFSLNQRSYRSFLWEIAFRYGEPNQLALLTGLDILKTADLRLDLVNISCPSLHISGEQDPLAPFNINFQREMIKNSGHYSLVTERDLLISRIRGFFDANRLVFT